MSGPGADILWVLDDGVGFTRDADLFTTRAIIREALHRPNVRQWLVSVSRLSVVSGRPHAACIPVTAGMLEGGPISFASPEVRPVDSFEAVFIRIDPPITQPIRHALIQLALAEPDGPLFVNSPTAILARGSKIFNQRFAGRLAPGLVSADIEQLLAGMAADPAAHWVVKPVDLASGRDVLKFHGGDAAAPPLLSALVARHGFLHLQHYVPAVEDEGEVRHLVFAGCLLASWRKVPARGDFRANLDQGASLEPLPPDFDYSDVGRLVSEVSGVEPGFVFYSADMIGPYLNELNVENVGGLPSADALYCRPHAAVLLELLLAEITARCRCDIARMPRAAC